MSEKAAQPSGAGAFVLGGALSSVFSIVASMVRSKVTAVWVGPEGFGVVALVTQAVALGLVASTMAAYTPLVRAMAKAVQAGEEAVDDALSGAFWLTVALHGAGGIAVAVIAQFLVPDDLPITTWAMLTLTIVGTLGTNLSTVAAQHFIATGRVRLMTLNGLAATAIGTGVAIPFVWLWRVPGMFWSLAVGNVLAAAVTWTLLRSGRGRWPKLLPMRVPPGFVREVFTLGAATVLGAFCLQGHLSAVRLLLEHFGGAEGVRHNGYFQAAWALAGTYTSLFLSGITSYFSPRMAGAGSATDLQKVVDECAAYVLKYLAPLALMGIAFGSLAIQLLYSERFGPSVGVLGLLLASAPLRAMSWTYTNTLPMRGFARQYLLSEVLSLLVGIPTQWAAIRVFGLAGAGYGIIAQHALYLPMAAALQRRSLGVSARASHLGIAYGVGALGLALQLSLDVASWLRWVVAVGCVVVMWRLGAISELTRRLSRRAA